MSLNLLVSYEQEFQEQVGTLKTLMQDDARMQVYFKAQRDPKEYTQAQTFLKQMEIESMNFFESAEYGTHKKEGDQVRKRIQKHKKEFDSVRKELRKLQ